MTVSSSSGQLKKKKNPTWIGRLFLHQKKENSGSAPGSDFMESNQNNEAKSKKARTHMISDNLCLVTLLANTCLSKAWSFVYFWRRRSFCVLWILIKKKGKWPTKCRGQYWEGRTCPREALSTIVLSEMEGQAQKDEKKVKKKSENEGGDTFLKDI